MRNAVLAAMVLLTAACGAYHFPNGGQTGNGSVTGNVVEVPCAPVQSADSTCISRPAPHLEVDFTAGGSTQAAITDSNGAFAIELPAATYKVSLKSPTRVLSGPSSVTVAAGSAQVANYVVDSGIRIPISVPVPPVPQPLPQQ